MGKITRGKCAVCVCRECGNWAPSLPERRCGNQQSWGQLLNPLHYQHCQKANHRSFTVSLQWRKTPVMLLECAWSWLSLTDKGWGEGSLSAGSRTSGCSFHLRCRWAGVLFSRGSIALWNSAPEVAWEASQWIYSKPGQTHVWNWGQWRRGWNVVGDNVSPVFTMFGAAGSSNMILIEIFEVIQHGNRPFSPTHRCWSKHPI